MLKSAQSTLTDESDDAGQLPPEPPTIGARPSTKRTVTAEPSVPKGQPLKEKSLARGTPLKEPSVARGTPLKEPSVAKGTPLKEPSNPKAAPLKEPSVAKGTPLKEPSNPRGEPLPPGSSKSKLAAVPPRASRPSNPAVPKTKSVTRMPAVTPHTTAPSLDEIEMRTESRPALNESAEASTDARPALPPKATESPTTLRPSLGASDVPITTPGPKGEIIEVSTDKGQRALADEPLQGNPAVSTMGYRSLRYREEGEKLFDKQTRMIIGAAVVGTFLLGAVLWKLASPKPVQPKFDPSAPTQLPRSVAEKAKPAEPEKQPDAVAEKNLDEVFLEEQVDAGPGKTRTVKVPAGTIQILSVPDVSISRNGQEIGHTPLTITLPIGKIELVATNREQGLTRTMYLDVAAKNDGVRWVFVRGGVDVHAPAGTRIAVDGRVVGKAPMGSISLWPGTHTLDITFPKGDKESRKFTIEAGVNQPQYFEAPVHDVDVSQ
jgi:hypothetical protein